MNNRVHRPPHAVFKIEELIRIGQFDEAQRCADLSAEFYRGRELEMLELYREAEKRKRETS